MSLLFSEVRGAPHMRTADEKLQYISLMTSQLLRLSEELNLNTLTYVLRLAQLEADTVELAPPTVGTRRLPGQRSN